MRKNELEQNLMFAEKRILELGDRVAALANENEELKKKNQELESKVAGLNENFTGEVNRAYEDMSRKLQSLSDDLYQHIERQNHQLSDYVDMLKKESDNKTSGLSDELYQHIEKQNKQLSNYADMLKQESDNKTSCLSDELYQHIAKQNSIRDNALAEYKKQLNDELWMRTFGFDNMISELQLNAVESVVPGNRIRLEALRDSHKGEKCFVIGNGPSLKAEDLDKLKQNNIFCFASKGIYNIFDETEWRPDVWGVSDLDYIKLKKNDLNQLDGFVKLVCTQAIVHVGTTIKDAIYYPFIQSERNPKFFNKDVTRGVHFYGTITGKLINFAVYMGFTEIYLLGCDNSLPVKKDSDGKVVIDNSKETHFSDKYFTNEEEAQKAYKNVDDILKSLKYVTDSYKDIKYNCDILGVKICNSTRGGELEVFPRVALEQALECCKK